MKTGGDIYKFFTHAWADKGEKVGSVYGEVDGQGVVGLTLAGSSSVPHVPAEGAVAFSVEDGGGLDPTAVVSSGDFVGTEWVHDPALFAWAYGDSSNQLAVRCADHLAVAGAHGWFVATQQRVAVVVETALVANGATSAVRSDTSGVSEDADSSGEGGFGRFLGKARSFAGSVQSGVADKFGGAKFTTLWECPQDEIDSQASKFVLAGKAVRSNSLARFVFRDGSKIDIKTVLEWNP